MIRNLLSAENYVIAVEHDLSILDYLSDFICVLYGQPGAYGVVTMPYSVREGINIFLAGFIPTENLRFREDELTFKVVENDAEKEKEIVEQQKQLSKPNSYKYPEMTKTLNTFRLTV
jgi:ATP-binding cassette subfamily E protein 1